MAELRTNETASGAQVLCEIEGPLATLTLNRPEKRNALSLDMMNDICEALREVAANPAVQVVILAARGPVFSAGHDLRELVDRDRETYRRIFDACVKMMELIQSIPQPVIAAVGGPATAAGCQLVATCDLAVAAESAWFATPGVKIGLFCSTPMVAVSRVIGRKRVMEMLLTGEPMPAREALAYGLVNRVVPPADLMTEVRALAFTIAALSPATVGLGKAAFYKQIDLPQHEAYEYTKEVMAINAGQPDAREGITAFLDKREPHWSGRR